MSDAFVDTPLLERLWAALEALLEAAEGTAEGSTLELSIDLAIRQVACAIVAAKEVALLEQRAPAGAVGAPAGGSPGR